MTTSTAWAAHAEALARWAWGRLVNRTDAWGAYWPLSLRAERGNSWTAPSRKQRGQVVLELDTLTGHFRGVRVRDLIGLHSTAKDNTSLWGGVDIDAHEGGVADPTANLAAALTWYWRLRTLGFRPLLTASNGVGGYHLLVLFSRPVPTPLVFAFLRWLTSDHAARGLPVAPETFPKQAHVAPGKYGNWLRLPGRHHSREYWSEVWVGSWWLTGAEAVASILSLTGDAPSLIPADVRPDPPRPTPPPPRRLYIPSGDVLERRIASYVARIPRLSTGQGRSKAAFGLASFLVRDLALSNADALPWLLSWDSGNAPPLGEDALQDSIRCAREYGAKPIGCGLECGSGNHHRGHHAMRTIMFTVRS
jgi:hypothetical protein